MASEQGGPGGRAGRRSGGAPRRWALLIAVGSMVLLVGSCTFDVGCRTYTFHGSGARVPLTVDESRCVASPPVEIPDATYAVALPVLAVGAVALAAYLIRRRRHRVVL